MTLEAYRKKRNFAATAEPAGTEKPAASGDSFVVQKHAARRLHYDFRLEMDGVLKSWAVTKGPSLVPGEKRLAVHVEDHPLEYGGFEGTIPKGEYGGGAVIVWDRGRWHAIGDAAKNYAKGHLDFTLDGEKLAGRWHLVRMARKSREKRDNWLLIKGDDEAARPNGPDILNQYPNSVKTGRRIEEVAKEAPGWSSKTGPIAPETNHPAAIESARVKGAKRGPMPEFVPPALATLANRAPTGGPWLHEIKFDGYRILARIAGGRVVLQTRSGLDWTDTFGPALPRALAALPVDAALIDGELVVENAGGVSDFSSLQADLASGRNDRFLYYAFDLLHIDGYDLRDCRLVDRKSLLERLLGDASGMVRFSAGFENEGLLVLRNACRLGLEGVVSKRRDEPYRSGRSRGWVKSKCNERQEFVIAGYVPSTVSARAIGSLVLGYYDGDRLIHAGRVGTGFTAAIAEDLFRRLDVIGTERAAFSEPLASDQARGVRFARPELVAEIEFRGWTADRRLRHAAFRGLRADKPAREVGRENSDAEVLAPSRPPVKLTHPDRVYWPDAGVTKLGLADYYAAVWRVMAPHVVARPLSLVRCPSGVSGECFFQKHAWRGIGRAIHSTRDRHGGVDEQILSIADIEGMIALVQGGVLELHVWGSALADIERPDTIVIDLDPGEEVAWQAIVSASREVRERLEHSGLSAFVKTSGGKGLHVVAPLLPEADWSQVKSFTKGLAETMAHDTSDRYVSVVTKTKRRGRILIDYLRNGRGATAVAPYSTRARPGAAVAMPLAWDELDELPGAAYFTTANALGRLSAFVSDPWQDFRRAAVPLPQRSRW